MTARLDRFDTMSLEELLSALRNDGWAVICHNDYIQPLMSPAYGKLNEQDYTTIDPNNKVKMTFWSFGHECGVFVKGEAFTDTEAVRLCAKLAHEVLSPSP